MKILFCYAGKPIWLWLTSAADAHQISSWVGFVGLVKQKMKDKLLMRLRLGNHVFQPKRLSFPKTNQVAWLSKPNQTLSWNEMWKHQKQHESGKTKLIMISRWHHLLQFCAMTSQVNYWEGICQSFELLGLLCWGK